MYEDFDAVGGMNSLSAIDPVASAVLDFVAIGESGGNYNAVIGDARSAQDLSQYTITQIQTIVMDNLLSMKRPSTAVGRYQIIRRTLQTLQFQMEIPADTKFTPALQDRLGRQLLITRGFNNWKTGALSDEAFAHNLSCEWASLPDPYNEGRSHYDGIGPNHAGTTLDKVYDALAHAKVLCT